MKRKAGDWRRVTGEDRSSAPEGKSPAIPLPRVVGGRLLMPAELQAIYRYVVETPVLKTVTEEIRAVVGDCLA